MSIKKHLVNLSGAEREQIAKVSRSNRSSLREKSRARILLLSDVSQSREQGGSLTDGEIATRLGCSSQTVYEVRRRAHERGAPASIRRAEQKTRKARKLDGRQEAQLVALTCSAPPQGRSRWSLVLLREHLIEMQVVEHIGWSSISAWKPFAQRSKKRAQAVAEEDVVYPAPGGRALCSRDGGRAGSL